MQNETEKKLSFWEAYFKKEWSYTAGAVMLVILAVSLVVVTGKAWGVTGPFAVWGGKLFELFGVSAESLNFWAEGIATYDFFKDIVSMTDLGIVLGALLAVLLAASFKIKKMKSWRQVVAAVLGGVLMGIGARLALGCNIGSLFSALPAFSLHGWAFLLFFFLGAAVGSQMLKRYFM